MGPKFQDSSAKAEAKKTSSKNPSRSAKADAGQLQGSPIPTINVIMEKKRLQDDGPAQSSSSKSSSAVKRQKASDVIPDTSFPPNNNMNKLMNIAKSAASAAIKQFFNTNSNQGSLDNVDDVSSCSLSSNTNNFSIAPDLVQHYTIDDIYESDWSDATENFVDKNTLTFIDKQRLLQQQQAYIIEKINEWAPLYYKMGSQKSLLTAALL